MSLGTPVRIFYAQVFCVEIDSVFCYNRINPLIYSNFSQNRFVIQIGRYLPRRRRGDNKIPSNHF